MNPQPTDEYLEQLAERDREDSEEAYGPEDAVRDGRERIRQLKERKELLRNRHAAAVAANEFKAMAEAAYGARTHASRLAEARIAWGATAAVLGLGSLAVAGTISQLSPTAVAWTAGTAAAVLGIVLLRHVGTAISYAFIEWAATKPHPTAEGRWMHRLARRLRTILPKVPVVALIAETAAVIALALLWIRILATLAGDG